ncbi:MAG: helix-turn-helix transcriptional regulator [Ruminococcaceae bacterium]|nr:helix-turn-helix transcriptional regulator [Oscillospiraceae bacterium]
MNFKLNSIETPIVVTRIANIHYFEFTDKYHTAKDSHNFCELLYVDKGKVSVKSDNFVGELESGQGIVHTAQENHFFDCLESSAPNLIIIGFECKSSEISRLSSNAIIFSDEQKRLLAEVVKEGMSVYAPPYDIPNTFEMKKRESYPYGADQMIKLRLEQLLIMLLRDKKIQDRVNSGKRNHNGKSFGIHQYLTENYREKITLDNLCFLFGTNKTTLCREFKAKYGRTVQEYIHHLRIREAKSLLKEGELTVTEIADKVGYSSVHYFCRAFKALEGKAPGEYVKTSE